MPQRANQCHRKCDSDLNILECGIGITAIRFRGRLKITLNARASTAKPLMPEAALLTPRFRIRLAPSSPSPAVNSLCEEGCCSSGYEQDATHHAALLLGARDCRRRFVSGILRSSAAFWHRSALRIVTKLWLDFQPWRA